MRRIPFLPWSHILILLALLGAAVGLRAAEPSKPAGKDDGARLSVQLVDDSLLIGSTSLESLAVQTSYAKVEIPFAKIQSVQPSKDHETLTLVLKNGDRLEGATAVKEIPFLTSFGKVTIAMKHVRSIRSSTPPAAAAVAAPVEVETKPVTEPAKAKELSGLTLNEARQLDAAVDQFALEKSKTADATVQFSDLVPYLKAGGELAKRNGRDALGNPFLIGPKVGDGVHVASKTRKALELFTGGEDFWGPYSGGK